MRAADVVVGQRFNRWTVVGPREIRREETYWPCRCECGMERIVRGFNLVKSVSKSCGCLTVEASRGRTYVHGMVNTQTYRSWAAMITRCTNEETRSFHRYGGRGIKVCDRWKVFAKFLEDMGEAPPKTSIDRIDNDGNYEPGNCRWATPEEQCNNTSANVYVEIDGIKQSVSRWARANGIAPTVAHTRMRKGWDAVRAVTVPVRSCKRKWKAAK